jgi:hypothetical protein
VFCVIFSASNNSVSLFRVRGGFLASVFIFLLLTDLPIGFHIGSVMELYALSGVFRSVESFLIDASELAGSTTGLGFQPVA